ncbi:DUF4349 domain-containing protein [Chitinophaga caseinilytica]|uniref:DUF4349 domain-containing protein n=1 Tax=Chitinophaga caseinilytica TaxID=2267521 RepID=UPI003C2B7E81
MKSPFLKRAWRLGRWFIAGFAALFIFRIVLGYVEPSAARSNSRSGFFDGLANIRKNYASEKLAPTMVQLADVSLASSQKYEKTAEVTSRSADFEKDDQTIRSKTAAFKGVIQYENADGLKGGRELHLLIGIAPEAFDSFYTEVRKIGEIRSMSVVKEDKTNEFRQLNARKASLENTRTSLMELKSKGGEVGDFVSLHDKILEIESKLQELGVELGDFNADNEFCTVKFSMYEGKAKQGITFLQRVKVALEWTIQYYCILLGIVFFATLSAFILLLIIDKLKIMQIVKGND